MTSYRCGRLLMAAALLAVPGVAAAQSREARQVTFAKDVAPIFQQRCQECHRPGAMAPMSLLRYEDVRPWARSEVYPDGSGVLLKAGEKARVSYHTHSYGEDTSMEIELGMVLYPKARSSPSTCRPISARRNSSGH